MRIRVEARQLRRVRWGAAGLFAVFLALAAGGRAVCGDAHRFEPPVLRGDATYYADFFHGRESASGEIFDQHKMVAAHRSLPFGSRVRVINVKNGRSVNVRIVDRGPYGQNYREGTIIDLSKAAARKLRMIRDGQIRVKVVVLSIGDGKRRDS